MGFNITPYFVSGSKDAGFGRVLEDLVQLFHFTVRNQGLALDENIRPRSLFLVSGKA